MVKVSVSRSIFKCSPVMFKILCSIWSGRSPSLKNAMPWGIYCSANGNYNSRDVQHFQYSWMDQSKLATEHHQMTDSVQILPQVSPCMGNYLRISTMLLSDKYLGGYGASKSGSNISAFAGDIFIVLPSNDLVLMQTFWWACTYG